jgi:excisionase family DNA binding protein
VTTLAKALLEELDDEALDALAMKLAPRLVGLISAAEKQSWPDGLLTCGQAAQRVNVHVETVRRAVRSGALAAGRVGRSPRIAVTDLDAWLATRPRRGTGARAGTRGATAGRRPLTEALANLDAPLGRACDRGP